MQDPMVLQNSQIEIAALSSCRRKTKAGKPEPRIEISLVFLYVFGQNYAEIRFDSILWTN